MIDPSEAIINSTIIEVAYIDKIIPTSIRMLQIKDKCRFLCMLGT